MMPNAAFSIALLYLFKDVFLEYHDRLSLISDYQHVVEHGAVQSDQSHYGPASIAEEHHHCRCHNVIGYSDERNRDRNLTFA